MHLRGQAIVTYCDPSCSGIAFTANLTVVKVPRWSFLQNFSPARDRFIPSCNYFLGIILLLRSSLYMCMWSVSNLLRVNFASSFDKKSFPRRQEVFKYNMEPFRIAGSKLHFTLFRQNPGHYRVCGIWTISWKTTWKSLSLAMNISPVRSKQPTHFVKRSIAWLVQLM